MLKFCKWCNQETCCICDLCGNYYCEYHKGATDAGLSLVYSDGNSYDHEVELKKFMARVFAWREFSIKGRLESRYGFKDTEPNLIGTYRYFGEKAWQKVVPFRIGEGCFCKSCFTNRVQSVIQELKNFFSLPLIKELKKSNVVCADELCILDSDYVCDNCGNSFCYNHSQECCKCHHHFCLIHKRDVDDYEIRTEIIGGCASQHRHWFSSVHWKVWG